MNKKNKTSKATDLADYLREQLRNKELRKCYHTYGKQLEIAYRILQLRKMAKISQKELARKIGTTQGNVARMEAGQQNFTVGTLDKVARIFNKNLEVSIK